uniref:Uncharacterized protein n=1 Tax=Meloidogyne hapla TaxID=6305 RepID=A0A1I8BUX6_MELHA
MQSGSSSASASPNINEFSLVEISLMMRILDMTYRNVLKFNDNENDNIPIQEFLFKELKLKLNESNDFIKENITRKIRNVIEYYEKILKGYGNQLTICFNGLDKTDKIIFTFKRLVDYGKLMHRNVYENFLNRFGINISKNTEENKPEGNSLGKISEQENNQLDYIILTLSQKEKDIFIFYHLIAITRVLIIKFIRENGCFYVNLIAEAYKEKDLP